MRTPPASLPAVNAACLCLSANETKSVTAARIEKTSGDMKVLSLHGGEPVVAQPAPHEFFRPGFIFAKLAGAFDVGHDGNMGNGGKTGKFVLTPALILTFSPGEKEQLLRVSVLSAVRPANPAARIRKETAKVKALSLGMWRPMSPTCTLFGMPPGAFICVDISDPKLPAL